MRSQPMFGFTTTTSPRDDEALHPAEGVDRLADEVPGGVAEGSAPPRAMASWASPPPGPATR